MQISKTKRSNIPVYKDNCTVSLNQSEIFSDDDWEEQTREREKKANILLSSNSRVHLIGADDQ